MMDALEVLDTLKGLGVRVEVNGEKLRVSPASLVPDALWERIREVRPAIIQHMTNPTAVPYMLEVWVKEAVPIWKGILREARAKGDSARAAYAIWMLTEVLKADIEEVGGQAKDENKKS